VPSASDVHRLRRPDASVIARLRSSLDQPTLDRLVLVALVVLAALLRFVDLPTRGTWDADQGHDMLVLRGLVERGEIPLLGPPTSIGDFHHGVLYYYILAPAAAITGASPLGVVAAIALAGVAAVAVTWWLARTIGGPVAGFVAGLLMAVSASAIDESTFIWNPNLIALSSSIALAAAWRAWTTREPRWWVLAAVGVIVTMHCHVLGSVLLPPVTGLWLADARRRGDDAERRAVISAGAIGVALLAASYIPLAIHELTNGFSELQAAGAFIAGGGEGSATSLPFRLVIVALRVLAWPLTGLITDAPIAALLAASLVVVIVVWRARAGDRDERTAVRWFGLTLGWSIIALTFLASGLATVIKGLPNDHYHAFADPIVFVVVGLGVAALARWRPRGQDRPETVGRRPPPVGAAAAILLVVAVVAFNISRWPPARTADGGFPAAAAAADRILAALANDGAPSAGGDQPIVLDSLPTFKSPDAVGFPLAAAGAEIAATLPGGVDAGSHPHVVLCDELFTDAIGAPCGGPAEDAVASALGFRLIDRFQAAPGRWVSVYRPG
jgi:hypothetical protein